MAEKILALYDSDFFYTTRFMEYVNRRKYSGFTFSAFTIHESLEEYLRIHTVEILLLGDGIEVEEEVIRKARYVYRLTEQVSRSADNPERIFKYQSAGTIMKEILSDYENKECIRGTVNGTKTKITSVFAPTADYTEQSFAWALSLLLAQQSRTLFILLDPISVRFYSEISEEGRSLTEFIYYLKEGFDLDKMRPLLWQNGRLSCLYGLMHGADISSITGEDIHSWVQGLKGSIDYDNIIFYIACYTEAMLELMKDSDVILTVFQETPYSSAKLQEWERQMCHSCSNSILEKISYVKLQKEDAMQKFPLTMQALKSSSSWEKAAQYLNT